MGCALCTGTNGTHVLSAPVLSVSPPPLPNNRRSRLSLVGILPGDTGFAKLGAPSTPNSATPIDRQSNNHLLTTPLSQTNNLHYASVDSAPPGWLQQQNGKQAYNVTSYVTDGKGIIQAVRTPDAWSRFAMENGAPSIADPGTVVGQSLFGYMASPMKEFYQMLVEKVSSGEIRVCSFRWFCDTPAIRRELLLVATWEDGGSVAFHQCMLNEAKHSAAFLGQLQYRNLPGAVYNCGICNRFLLGRDWLSPAEYYTAKVQQEGKLKIGCVSHRICPDCELELNEVHCCIPKTALAEAASPAAGIRATANVSGELRTSGSTSGTSSFGPSDNSLVYATDGKPLGLCRPSLTPADVLLIVLDDDLVSCRVAAHYAKVAGYRPECFYCPTAALERLREVHTDPSPAAAAPPTVTVLVTDIVMPGMSGVELLRQLHKEGIRVPTIGMSGSPEFEGGCLEAGMAAFLPKPLRCADFAAVLHRVAGVAE